MVSDTVYDVAIIGAGIAGASLAWQLAARARVVVLERESQPGMHATGRSAAMFMETYGTAATQALTRASRAFYEHPPEGFAEHELLTPRGVLYVATPEQRAQLTLTHDSLVAQGGQVTIVSAEEALARVPCLRPDQLAGAVAEPDAQDIDVHALHQGYLRGARQAGAALQLNAELTEARQEAGVWTLVLADGSRIQARCVVNAAGAWADQVGKLLGAQTIGLEPRRRAAFTFAGPEGMDFAHWPLVMGIDESYYFKPDAGQLLGSPANADPVPPHDVMPEELDIAIGIHHIEQATTLSIRRPRHTWAGLRSFVPDSDFVVGWDAQASGVFWLAGQGGYGVQTAAATAELAAALLLREPVPESISAQRLDLAAVSPQRLR